MPEPTTGGDIVTPARVFSGADYAILEFEQSTWASAGAKQAEIYDRFAMSAARYYMLLNWIIDQPEAEAYNAQLVGRLRRLREQRRQVRTVGTVAAGFEPHPDYRGIRPMLAGGVVR